ncbi:hypothetical protein GF376_00285 [Candidatus Peregrinibacteria bacterium]|nr:hypothetical protein [Candidatus Peregrinibacteria bacterium]
MSYKDFESKKNIDIKYSVFQVARILKNKPYLNLFAIHLDTGQIVKIELNSYDQPICVLGKNKLLLDDRFVFDAKTLEIINNESNLNGVIEKSNISSFAEARSELEESLFDLRNETKKDLEKAGIYRIGIHKTVFWVDENFLHFMTDTEIAEIYLDSIKESMRKKAERINNKGKFNIRSFGKIIDNENVISLIKEYLESTGFKFLYTKPTNTGYVRAVASKKYIK